MIMKSQLKIEIKNNANYEINI